MSILAGLRGNAAVARYEDVGINLVSTSPGDIDAYGSLTMFDFIDRIEQGNRDLVADFVDGITEDVAGDDFWTAIQSAARAAAAWPTRARRLWDGCVVRRPEHGLR